MKKITTRKYEIFLISILLLASFVFCKQTDSNVINKVNEIIEQVRLKRSPDKRISVFKVNARKEKDKIVLKGEILSLEAKHEITSRLKSELKEQIVDSLTLLPHPILKHNNFGIITLSVAQVRKQPDVYYEIITQEIMGAEVRILKKNGWWLYCQFEDNYLGWLMKSSIVFGDKEFIEDWREQPKLIVMSNYGQVWEKPSLKNSRPVCDVVLGNKVINLGSKENWFRVKLPDGRKGFIKSNLVMDIKEFNKRPKATANDLIDLAYTFLGIPYFWGGKSTKGFDCSGLTQTIYKMNGIQLQRDANMQIKQGKEVQMDDSLINLEPGDLLFFGKNIESITHVGMYIGEANFIHSDGMVQINSFNPEDQNYSKYRRKGLQAVRRILKD